MKFFTIHHIRCTSNRFLIICLRMSSSNKYIGHSLWFVYVSIFQESENFEKHNLSPILDVLLHRRMINYTSCDIPRVCEETNSEIPSGLATSNLRKWFHIGISICGRGIRTHTHEMQASRALEQRLSNGGVYSSQLFKYLLCVRCFLLCFGMRTLR